jgi:hypothetical protein
VLSPTTASQSFHNILHRPEQEAMDCSNFIPKSGHMGTINMFKLQHNQYKCMQHAITATLQMRVYDKQLLVLFNLPNKLGSSTEQDTLVTSHEESRSNTVRIKTLHLETRQTNVLLDETQKRSQSLTLFIRLICFPVFQSNQ